MTKLLSTRRVCEILDISRSTLWRMVRRGSFPEPLNISPGRVGFVDAEVELWIRERVNKRSKEQ